MFATSTAPTNINHLNKIPNNGNINVVNFHNSIVE